MKALRYWILAFVIVLSGLSLAQSQEKKDAGPASDGERLIGAWHLVSMGAPGADRESNLAA